MTAAIDITTEQRKTLLALLRRFIPGVAVWAYGSRVKWTARPNSDLDLVAFTTSAQRPQVAELKEALAESNLPFPVDLHVWDEVPERFHEIIRKECVVLQETKQPKSDLGSAGEWQEVTISEIASSQRNALVGGPFGSNLVSSDYVDHGVPVIRGQNMGERWVSGEFAYVTSAKAESLAANLARPGDIVFTQRGTLGQVCLVPEGPFERYLVSQSQMKLTVDREAVEPLFLYYVFRSAEQQDYIRQRAIQTGVPHTNLGILRAIPVLLPPLSQQRAIAHILGTLDDKIELNRRMNETLEAIARALFKSWFVDFDPVRAKAEGRDPGLPNHIADLFPDSFEDSELGEIPKGWRVGCVDDEFDLTMGQSPPGNTYNEVGEGAPFFQGRSDFGFRFPSRRVYCTAPTRLAKKGDTLISVRAPVGDINMASEDCAIGRGVAAARHKSGSRSYTYQFMRSLEEVFARFEAEGTVFGSIGKKDFHAISYVVPPRGLVVGYEGLIAAIDNRIEINDRNFRTLAALRDELLPKLVSGAIRVKDAKECKTLENPVA